MKWKAKNMRNAEGQFQGGRIFSLLDRHNRLARHAHLITQLLLRHFVLIEPELTNIITDLMLSHLKFLCDKNTAAKRFQRSLKSCPPIQ